MYFISKMNDLISAFENKLIISKPNLITLKAKNNTEQSKIVLQNISNGAKCSENGNKYEKLIWNNLKNTTINNEKFNTQTELELGGSTSHNDIICNFNSKIKNISIEIKNTICAEFIQMDVHKEGDKWVGPRITRKSHPLSVINRYLIEINSQKDLYYGNLPPLNKTRKEFDEWQEWLKKKKKEVKEDNDDNEDNDNTKDTKDYFWKSRDPNFIKNNYKDKGCSYIQINKYGLYHLGEDICNFDVPEFKPDDITLRLRCKRRGSKGCVPSSITMSAYISGLVKSKYSLDMIDNLPENLIYKI